MNEKGEMNLLFVLMVVGLSGILILCALRLQRSFGLLEKRTQLFLCVKETEGEMVRYMKVMGRTNWAIKHLDKVKYAVIFFPPLAALAANAEEAKKGLILIQNLTLIPYMKKLSDLRGRGCPLDLRMLKTPFEISGVGYARDGDDTAKLRSKKWSYAYVSFPYSISVDWNASGYEALKPLLKRNSWENGAKLSSILSSY
jgi:hypothetical protein